MEPVYKAPFHYNSGFLFEKQLLNFKLQRINTLQTEVAINKKEVAIEMPLKNDKRTSREPGALDVWDVTRRAKLLVAPTSRIIGGLKPAVFRRAYRAQIVELKLPVGDSI
jgi:hypothetical protein